MKKLVLATLAAASITGAVSAGEFTISNAGHYHIEVQYTERFTYLDGNQGVETHNKTVQGGQTKTFTGIVGNIGVRANCVGYGYNSYDPAVHNVLHAYGTCLSWARPAFYPGFQ